MPEGNCPACGAPRTQPEVRSGTCPRCILHLALEAPDADAPIPDPGGREDGAAEPSRIGPYVLRERIGEGGMGEVWLGRHRLLARSAAIKLIRPEMLSDGSVERAAVALGRFEREARATAALTSPHTIRLFDFGQTHDGTFYYAIPQKIDELVMACLRKDPNRRPRDASELLYLVSSIAGDWDHHAARRWWETHLPDLSAPSMLAPADWPANIHPVGA